MILYPRLPDVVAELVYSEMGANAGVRHAAQIYAPVGGRRATDAEIEIFAREVCRIAKEYGYPGSSTSEQKVAFDRAAAPVLRTYLDFSWSEAGTPGLWSFIALVVLPDVTFWRFGWRNRERWVASDLTRHTWARLWWQAVVFAEDMELLSTLSESDLNQFLERRTIGGDSRLVVTLARVVLAVHTETTTRRYLVRDVTARVMRRLAFVDVRALSDAQVRELCQTLTDESVLALAE